MFGGKEPVLPLLSSTARTVDGSGTDGAQQRRPSAAAAADGGGGAAPSYEQQDVQSTDELLYATHLILPFNCGKPVQRGALGWAVPLLVKGLELYLLVNLFREDTYSRAIRDAQMQGVENAPDPNCPMAGGKNVYSISADYFFSLSLMAAIYGAAVCTNDLMFVGRGIINFSHDCWKIRVKKQKVQPDQVKWFRLFGMCACNLALHFFCLRAVAIAVASSTSVAGGVANFAVIFIVLELDQKVAESLGLKMLIAKKKDDEEQAAVVAPLDKTLTAEERAKELHALKVMDNSQRTELIVRTLLFLACMAIYIWYSYDRWFYCPRAPWNECSGLESTTFNKTAYVNYREDLYDVYVENNRTVVWDLRPGKVDDFATRLPYWCAMGYQNYSYTVQDGQLNGPIWFTPSWI